MCDVQGALFHFFHLLSSDETEKVNTQRIVCIKCTNFREDLFLRIRPDVKKSQMNLKMNENMTIEKKELITLHCIF